ncbi:MAG: transposase [Thermodesulfobacteriota bacterium]
MDTIQTAGLPMSHTPRPDNDAAAHAYWQELCWPDGRVFCPRCRQSAIYNLASGRKRCPGCGYTFHDFSGRWLNSVGLGPRHWLYFLHLFCQNHPLKDAAAVLGRSYNVVYKAATVCRFAITAGSLDGKQIMGQQTGLSACLQQGKVHGLAHVHSRIPPVFGILERRGMAFLDYLPQMTTEDILHFHRNFSLPAAARGNILVTGKYRNYSSLILCGNPDFPWHLITPEPSSHPESTPFCAFVLNQLKGYKGISPPRFPLYLKEIEFRYNHSPAEQERRLAKWLCDFVPRPCPEQTP